MGELLSDEDFERLCKHGWNEDLVELARCERTARKEAEAALAEARGKAIREVAEWVRDQRNDIPATGGEFANAILALLTPKDQP